MIILDYIKENRRKISIIFINYVTIIFLISVFFSREWFHVVYKEEVIEISVGLTQGCIVNKCESFSEITSNLKYNR